MRWKWHSTFLSSSSYNVIVDDSTMVDLLLQLITEGDRCGGSGTVNFFLYLSTTTYTAPDMDCSVVRDSHHIHEVYPYPLHSYYKLSTIKEAPHALHVCRFCSIMLSSLYSLRSMLQA